MTSYINTFMKRFESVFSQKILLRKKLFTLNNDLVSFW